jgi:predicted branched-subunit amino acid permease
MHCQSLFHDSMFTQVQARNKTRKPSWIMVIAPAQYSPQFFWKSACNMGRDEGSNPPEGIGCGSMFFFFFFAAVGGSFQNRSVHLIHCLVETSNILKSP